MRRTWWLVGLVLAGCEPEVEPRYPQQARGPAPQYGYGGGAPGQQAPPQQTPAPPPIAPTKVAATQPQDPYAAPQPSVAPPQPGQIQWYGKPPPDSLPVTPGAPPPVPAAPATPAQPTTTPPKAPPPQPPAAARRLTFNGRAATKADLENLSLIELMYGSPAPDGDYWYDPKSGAAGAWGGPTLGSLPAGIPLGGPLPANASGGGNGRLTGVFINGRELHPIDVKVLYQVYGQVQLGRWWVDGQGNAGREGGPVLFNLVALARQRAAAGKGKGADSYYRSDGTGNNAFVGGGCVSSSAKTYDYYGPGC